MPAPARYIRAGIFRRARQAHRARALAHREWKNVSFTTAGFGAKKPIASNTKPDGSDDPDGRQKNRRVEIVIGKK
jgi:outer membrane protein OmpA-like peptidoglycan-associated protein